ncbi:MAG: hypothetical protein JST64_04590 [Actinobacteria bacterium]|nr:hypothetical protein [Actinomycetota bacterium]
MAREELDGDRSPPRRRWGVLGSWWLLALVVAAVYLLSPVRSATTHDPAFVPMTAHSLVHRGSLAIDDVGADRLVGHPIVVTDGSLPAGAVVEDPAVLRRVLGNPGVQVFDYFPWTSALFAVPGVVVTDAVAAVAGTPDSARLIRDGDFELIHTASASFVVIGAVLLFRATALIVLGGGDRRRRLLANGAALVFALGTSAWSTASRALWQHTPSLLLLSLLLYLAVRIDRTDPTRPTEMTASGEPTGDRVRRPSVLDGAVVALGASAVGAAIVRPTNLAVAVLLVGWVIVRRRATLPSAVLSVALGALSVAVGFVVCNLVLLGDPLPAYYSSGRVVFGAWFPEAVASNWISPSRGLLVASPILVLAVSGAVVAWRDPQRRSLVAVLWVSVLAVTISVSAFPHWWAGHSFGPRFMTEAVPQLAVLALPAVDVVFRAERLRRGAPTRRRALSTAALVVVLALWSIAFHASGSVAGVTGCWNIYPVDVDSDPGRIWSVLDAQVLEPVHRLLDADRRAAEDGVCLSR